MNIIKALSSLAKRGTDDFNAIPLANGPSSLDSDQKEALLMTRCNVISKKVEGLITKEEVREFFARLAKAQIQFLIESIAEASLPELSGPQAQQFAFDCLDKVSDMAESSDNFTIDDSGFRIKTEVSDEFLFDTLMVVNAPFLDAEKSARYVMQLIRLAEEIENLKTLRVN